MAQLFHSLLSRSIAHSNKQRVEDFNQLKTCTVFDHSLISAIMSYYLLLYCIKLYRCTQIEAGVREASCKNFTQQIGGINSNVTSRYIEAVGDQNGNFSATHFFNDPLYIVNNVRCGYQANFSYRPKYHTLPTPLTTE